MPEVGFEPTPPDGDQKRPQYVHNTSTIRATERVPQAVVPRPSNTTPNPPQPETQNEQAMAQNEQTMAQNAAQNEQPIAQEEQGPNAVGTGLKFKIGFFTDKCDK